MAVQGHKRLSNLLVLSKGVFEKHARKERCPRPEARATGWASKDRTVAFEAGMAGSINPNLWPVWNL